MSAFGMVSVSGRSRVARPPARMTAGMRSVVVAIGHLVMRNDSRAIKVEMESNFFQSAFSHGVAEPGFFAGIEHQKTSASGADELAAQRAVGHRNGVPFIDFPVAHFRTPLFLVFPVSVHEPAEFGDVSAFQRLLARQSEL